MIDYGTEEFSSWLSENVTLSGAFSVESLKAVTAHVLMGRNYRLITETNTKDKLFLNYLWLLDIVKKSKAEFGNDWKEGLLNDLMTRGRLDAQQKNLLYFLVGLTNKTATNLGITKSDLPQVMTDLIAHINELFEQIDRRDDIDNAWVLMVAGSITLNIRGSDKSKIGKHFEKVIVKAALTILGLTDEVNFWMNIDRDNEVDRETDAEIETRRGRVRMEVGLIASGNQEVIEDKIGRVGRGGIVLFDVVGTKTRIYETATRMNVELIQMRNNQPLVQLYRYLGSLVRIDLIEPPTLEADVFRAVNDLPNSLFEPFL
jgi:hypothetical protein